MPFGFLSEPNRLEVRVVCLIFVLFCLLNLRNPRNRLVLFFCLFLFLRKLCS